jgi:hypothetical protein
VDRLIAEAAEIDVLIDVLPGVAELLVKAI